ncbi:MAG TPA: hypothetical protein VHQ01_11360, partial [Pyrinomonadaceae bacterium]|nr:hypothetical protein [Pyrinomonadaceae bacterium]
MKKIATAAISLTLLLSAWLPAFGQKTKLRVEPETSSDNARQVKPGISSETRSDGVPVAASAKFGQVSAFSDGRGVLIQWQMESETRNAGFYVYRVSGKGLQLVSDIMVPGSASHSTGKTLYGEKYEKYDPLGTPGATYVVRSVIMDGRRVDSDQVSASSVSDLSAVSSRTSEAFEIAARSNSSLIETEVSSLAPDSGQTPNLTAHRLVVAQPGVKIAVKSEGLYRVTRAELQAAGFNLSSSSTKWRLFMEGVEQSIIVGPNDQYIEFYGKGRDDDESDTRVYYLIADTTAGKRMGTASLPSNAGAVLSNTYQNTLEIKERIRDGYVQPLLNGDASNYYGRLVQSTPTSVAINLLGIDPSVGQNFTVKLKLLGDSDGPHAVSMIVNGHDVGTITGDGL